MPLPMVRRYDVVGVWWRDIVNSTDGEWLDEKGALRPDDGRCFTAGVVWCLMPKSIMLGRDRLPHLKKWGAQIEIPRGVIEELYVFGRIRRKGKGWEFERA